MLNIRSVCLILVLPINVLSREQSNSESNNYSFLENYGEIILNDISKQADPLDQIAEYRDYVDNMYQIDISSTSTVMLSYLVSELMEAFPENEDLKYIIDNLPIEIARMPWARPFNIFNEGTKNYLCADDEPLQHQVYSSFRPGVNCFWTFNILENGLYFRIQNNAHYRYMYGSPKRSVADQQLRTISTADDTVNITYLSDRWQFKPYRNDENIFELQIKNYLWKEYIMAQKSLDIFMGEFSLSDTNLYLWRLTTESNHPHIDLENELPEHSTHYNEDSVTTARNNMSTTRLTEYVNLFELMKKHDAFHSVAAMELDYDVIQLLEQYPNNYDLIEMEKYFRELWPRFPWNRQITIQNGDGNFLCRQTDTKIYIGPMLIRLCSWTFLYDSRKSNFRIKAFSNNFYLIAEHKSFFDFGKRNIVMSNEKADKDTDKWQLHYPGSQKDGVKIENVAWKETFFRDSKACPALKSNPNCQRSVCAWYIREL